MNLPTLTLVGATLLACSCAQFSARDIGELTLNQEAGSIYFRWDNAEFRNPAKALRFIRVLIEHGEGQSSEWVSIPVGGAAYGFQFVGARHHVYLMPMAKFNENGIIVDGEFEGTTSFLTHDIVIQRKDRWIILREGREVFVVDSYPPPFFYRFGTRPWLKADCISWSSP